MPIWRGPEGNSKIVSKRLLEFTQRPQATKEIMETTL